MFCTRYFLSKFCTCYCNIDQQFQTLIPYQISKEFWGSFEKIISIFILIVILVYFFQQFFVHCSMRLVGGS